MDVAICNTDKTATSVCWHVRILTRDKVMTDDSWHHLVGSISVLFNGGIHLERWSEVIRAPAVIHVVNG